jgi:ribonuclease HIII
MIEKLINAIMIYKIMNKIMNKIKLIFIIIKNNEYNKQTKWI